MKSSEIQHKRQASRNLIVLFSSNLFLAFKITLQKMMAGDDAYTKLWAFVG